MALRLKAAAGLTSEAPVLVFVAVVGTLALAGAMLGRHMQQAALDAEVDLFNSLEALHRAQLDLQKLKEEHAQLQQVAFEQQGQVLDLYHMRTKLQREAQAAPEAAAAPPAPVEAAVVAEVAEAAPARERRAGLDNGVPVCRGAAPMTKSKLPVYLFTAGVEGAGHHALETVWAELQRHYHFKVVGFNPGLHSMAKEAEVDRAYQFTDVDFDVHRQTLENFFKMPWNQEFQTVVDARNSYPEGFGVGNLAHPDLVALAQLDGVLFDLRVLVLYRDPAACAWSAVRRFQVKEFQYKNYEFQARSVQESLTVINNALGAVPCGKYFVLKYEDFIHNPGQFAEPLARLIGASPEIMAKCFGRLHAPDSSRAAGQDSPEVQAKKAHLKVFFQFQHDSWPVLAGRVAVPALALPTTPTLETLADWRARQQQVLAADMQASQQYLKIRWHTNLGFNNMRFIMEMSLYLAQLLKRHLVLPPRLRMRKCTDPDLCARTDCVLEHEYYWCPLGAFLDMTALQLAGAVYVEDEAALLHGKTTKTIKDAFGEMYSKDTLYLERLPLRLKQALGGVTTGARYAKDTPLKFSYHRFHLGCELSYFEVKHPVWNSENAKDREKQLVGFVDKFGHHNAEVLFLDGVPHHIGLTPTFWSTPEALEASRQVWENGIQYSAHIVRMAEHVRDTLVKASPTNSYVCAHLRRGDFVTAGWLGDAKNLSLVTSTIRQHLQPGEPFYLATDEGEPEVLQGFRQLGAHLWSDQVDGLRAFFTGEPEVLRYLPFEDHVGLIEQRICAEARLFLGSKCSSFTGGILNLRRTLYGDTSWQTVVTPPKE